MIAQALSPERVAASTLAVASTIALQTFFCAAHPPAAATTLLIALGGLPPTGRTVATVALGVTLVALIGSAVRKRLLN
jgi:CBS-domain-containing membrane protein